MTAFMDLDLSTTLVDARALVTVSGEVDLETASRLGDHALDAVRDVCPHLALDLSGVSFMDSTGLKVLLSIQRRTDLAGGSLVLVGPRPPVRKILALTGLDVAFQIADTLADLTPVNDGAAPTP